MKRFALLLAVVLSLVPTYREAGAAPGDDLTVKEAELSQLESDISAAPAPTDPTAAMWRACAILDVSRTRHLISRARFNERTGGVYDPYFRVDAVPFGGPYTHAVVIDPVHNMLMAGRQHLNASLVAYPYSQPRWSVLGQAPGYFKVTVLLP